MTSNLLLIGRGRLATHLKTAWSELRLETWDRSQSEELLLSKLKDVDLVLLAISDGAIADFHSHYKDVAPQDSTWIHFSGALNVPGLVDLHPLMTFGPSLYSTADYSRIPFVSATLTQWPAGLARPNPLFKIAAVDKARYHALCVLGGNFSNLLWRKANAGFAALGLPADIARAYAERSLQNVFENPQSALTGPLVRGDVATQEKNLRALEADPYQHVYRAFQKAYQEETDESP